MSGDVHVRFCESAGVRFPRATLRVVTCRTKAEAQTVLAEAKTILTTLGVTLNVEKTRIVHVAHGRPLGSMLLENKGATPIYSYHYHKDKDKAKELEAAHAGFPIELSTPIFGMMIEGKICAILALARVIEVIQEAGEDRALFQIDVKKTATTKVK